VAAAVDGVVVVAVVAVVVDVTGTIAYNNLLELKAFNSEHVLPY
jgi:hypothetical protein